MEHEMNITYDTLGITNVAHSYKLLINKYMQCHF